MTDMIFASKNGRNIIVSLNKSIPGTFPATIVLMIKLKKAAHILHLDILMVHA